MILTPSSIQVHWRLRHSTRNFALPTRPAHCARYWRAARMAAGDGRAQCVCPFNEAGLADRRLDPPLWLQEPVLIEDDHEKSGRKSLMGRASAFTLHKANCSCWGEATLMTSGTDILDAVVVGAGWAGLGVSLLPSSSYCLRASPRGTSAGHGSRPIPLSIGQGIADGRKRECKPPVCLFAGQRFICRSAKRPRPSYRHNQLSGRLSCRT
jgi:hypothetical protein